MLFLIGLLYLDFIYIYPDKSDIVSVFFNCSSPVDDFEFRTDQFLPVRVFISKFYNNLYCII